MIITALVTIRVLTLFLRHLFLHIHLHKLKLADIQNQLPRLTKVDTKLKRRILEIRPDSCKRTFNGCAVLTSMVF
jgi:hypothetical protein